MNVLTDSLITRYDERLRSLVIEHPDKREFTTPLVQVREETFAQMNFDECAKFVGARLLLLMPSMREHFKEEIGQMQDR
jgi:hypothetical protein